MENSPSKAHLNIIGPSIRRVRREKDLTQQALADKIAAMGFTLDRSAISRIEKGTRRVTDIDMGILADVLGPEIFQGIYAAVGGESLNDQKRK